VCQIWGGSLWKWRSYNFFFDFARAPIGTILPIHHRLNGSSSTVLTATSLSYRKAKNSTPHRIKTPNPIKIKFGTVDYVGEGTRQAKFYANPSKGASREMGEIYAKIFIAIHIPFFQKLTYRSDPSADFCARWLNHLDQPELYPGNIEILAWKPAGR